MKNISKAEGTITSARPTLGRWCPMIAAIVLFSALHSYLQEDHSPSSRFAYIIKGKLGEVWW